MSFTPSTIFSIARMSGGPIAQLPPEGLCPGPSDTFPAHTSHK